MRNPSNEHWLWIAHYRDGSILEEYPDEGEDHAFKDINLDECVAFQLVPQYAHLGVHIVKLTPEDGQRLIFFRRRIASAASDVALDENGDYILSTRETITCIGWQRTIEGKNVSAYTFYFADGTSLVTDQHQPI